MTTGSGKIIVRGLQKWIKNLKGGVILALVVVLVTSAITFYLLDQVITETKQSNKAKLVQQSLDDIGFHVKSAESAMRAYLLIGDSTLISSVLQSQQLTWQNVDTLRARISKFSRTGQLLDSLHFYIEQRFSLLNQLRANYEEGNLTDHELLIQINNGEKVMMHLLGLTHQIGYAFQQHHLNRFSSSESNLTSVRVLIGLLFFISIAVIILAFVTVLKSQQEISVREIKYRNLFEMNSQVIFTLNHQFELVDINSAVIEQLGYDPEEIRARGLLQIISEPQRSQLEQAVDNHSNVSNLEVQLTDKENQLKIFLLNLVITDPVKVIYQGSLINIHDRRMLEEEKVSLDRYANVGRVARLIAHEVRNPLTNISLSLEAISNGSEDQLNYYLKIISNNTQRINALISELLSTTKLTEFNFESISINQLLDESIQTAADRIKLNEVNIVKNFDPEICSIHGDAEKLKIAFLNIIVNAIEAMTLNGTITLTSSKLKDKCLITIADNGKGISKDHLKQIFQPFFSTRRNGTGLGLATVQNIILSHKGTIHLESEENNGTTFFITLPLST